MGVYVCTYARVENVTVFLSDVPWMGNKSAGVKVFTCFSPARTGSSSYVYICIRAYDG